MGCATIHRCGMEPRPQERVDVGIDPYNLAPRLDRIRRDGRPRPSVFMLRTNSDRIRRDGCPRRPANPAHGGSKPPPYNPAPRLDRIRRGGRPRPPVLTLRTNPDRIRRGRRLPRPVTSHAKAHQAFPSRGRWIFAAGEKTDEVVAERWGLYILH